MKWRANWKDEIGKYTKFQKGGIDSTQTQIRKEEKIYQKRYHYQGEEGHSGSRWPSDEEVK